MSDWVSDLGSNPFLELKAELEVLYQEYLDSKKTGLEFDFRKHFSFPRVDQYTFDTLRIEAKKKGMNIHFFASFRLVDFMIAEKTFEKLYKAVRWLHEITNILERYKALENLTGQPKDSEDKYVIDGNIFRRSEQIGIFAPIWDRFSNLCKDMKINQSYFLSIALLWNSEEHDVYEKYIGVMVNSALNKLKQRWSEVVKLAWQNKDEKTMNKVIELAERIAKSCNIDVDDSKKDWKIRDVKTFTRGIAKKVAKMRKMKIGEFIDYAVITYVTDLIDSLIDECDTNGGT